MSQAYSIPRDVNQVASCKEEHNIWCRLVLESRTRARPIISINQRPRPGILCVQRCGHEARWLAIIGQLL